MKVILKDEFEPSFYLYQLLDTETNQSTYIEKDEAEATGLPIYDLIKWARGKYNVK